VKVEEIELREDRRNEEPGIAIYCMFDALDKRKLIQMGTNSSLSRDVFSK